MDKLLQLKNKYVELSRGFIDYDKFNNYLLTYHSTCIEGATLTHSEVVHLFEDGLTPLGGKPFSHVLMVKDHLDALKFILDLDKKKQKLTVKTIQTISSLLLKNTGVEYKIKGESFDATKGEFRKGGVHVGNHTFVNFNKVPGLVKELVNYINSQLDSCSDFLSNSVLAFDAHYQMVSIHPFADGNGRLSRLIMNYIQHYHGHPLTPVFSEDKALYFDALQETRDKQNTDIFRKFMIQQSQKYFESEIAMMKKQPEQKVIRGKGLSFLF
ncbi:Fic family protein [Prolixibacter sp. NT017]|uniref:Fic family protein n=1 Tax=Prolixibacter sp. NT017 TaxID=2652390 RepID=UPI001282DF08|nr:Fic family protein [Prolixibacter sp. NT017]GET25835.1 cell filamentation protein Fic [Prolixibacter sp. NT017]